MYMEPIVRAKASASPAKRRLVGAPVLVASAVVMLPWLAVNLAFSGLVLGVRSIGRAPKLLLSAVDYAGTITLGE